MGVPIVSLSKKDSSNTDHDSTNGKSATEVSTAVER